jgi:hypothetical protein
VIVHAGIPSAQRNAGGLRASRLSPHRRHASAAARRPGLDPGVLFNIGLRVLILAFTVDALINAGDPRFAGKALGPRNVGIMLGFSMLFPVVYLVARRWRRYPFWFDDLYLSIFALDMAGNSLDLYNTVEWWDHVPHFHGPGALSMVLMGVFGLPALAAAGLATILHVVLECWEFYGDVLLGTHNVKGIWDSINDLSYGIAGMILYTVIFRRFAFTRQRRAKPDKRRG